MAAINHGDVLNVNVDNANVDNGGENGNGDNAQQQGPRKTALYGRFGPDLLQNDMRFLKFKINSKIQNKRGDPKLEILIDSRISYLFLVRYTHLTMYFYIYNFKSHLIDMIDFGFHTPFNIKY
jgi:hypothetical protein